MSDQDIIQNNENQDNSNTEKIDDKPVNEEFDNSSLSDAMNSIFNKSNIIFIIWFLAIYFIIYFVLGLFLKSENGSFTGGYIFDTMMFVLLIVILLVWYYSSSSDKRENMFTNVFNFLKDYMNESMSIFSTGLFIVLLYTFAFLLRIPTDSSKPIFFSLMENGAWIILVLTIFVQFFKYIFGISILDYISSLWGDLPKEEKKEEDDKVVSNTDEVFNISNNLYNYDDAQAICNSYGARLANYDEIEKAYNKGAEWCNYGWSANQMAFFPTQKSTWDKLQQTKNHKNDCGRPGVNGGYMKNPYIRFGVNCYGKKPVASDDDLNRMNAKKNHVYPKTREDLLLDAKVQFWKDNADKLLKINSFNENKWSEY
jgi:hypothetical protein